MKYLVESGFERTIFVWNKSDHISIHEFQLLGVKNVVGLALQSSQDGSEAIRRFQELICPMFDDQDCEDF